VVGASLAVAFIFNYPSGRLGDVVGRRPMMIAGALLYGVAGIGLAVAGSLPVLFAVRVVQGLGIAAILPSANALVADLAPEAERGRAYSWITGALLAGLTAGPAIGGLLSVIGLTAVFVFAAATGFVAAAIIPLAIPRVIAAQPGAPTSPATSPSLPWRNIAAVLFATGGPFVLFGAYETAWSLFMHHLGAADWVVGITFTLFGLPFVLVTPLAGWAADRYDRRLLALAGYAAACGWALVYPSLTSIPLIIFLGLFESVGNAFSAPAISAQLMSGVAEHSRGRAQGLALAVQSGSQATGALVAGALFGMGIGMPFYVGAAAGFLSLAIAGALFFVGAPSAPHPTLPPYTGGGPS